jgi:hypothetical protein
MVVNSSMAMCSWAIFRMRALRALLVTLDSQVQQAYLKRTRTMGKSKKGAQPKHRPGGAGSMTIFAASPTAGRETPAEPATWLPPPAPPGRCLEIAQEHMAMLEFTTIQDDLDSQVQQAYLKRTRTMVGDYLLLELALE